MLGLKDVELTVISDERGKLMRGPKAKRLSVGEKVWLIPVIVIRPSACTTSMSASGTVASRHSGR